MEKWQIEEKIRYLEDLNKDPVERPAVKKNREIHIEFYKRLLREKEVEEIIEKEKRNEI